MCVAMGTFPVSICAQHETRQRARYYKREVGDVGARGGGEGR